MRFCVFVIEAFAKMLQQTHQTQVKHTEYAGYIYTELRMKLLHEQEILDNVFKQIVRIETCSFKSCMIHIYPIQ